MAEHQPSLLDVAPRFDSGVELKGADQVRLGAQIKRVLHVLSDAQWHSVPEIRASIHVLYDVHDPEPSISAQIRNLKKPKHGGYTIERRRVNNVYEFRLV